MPKNKWTFGFCAGLAFFSLHLGNALSHERTDVSILITTAFSASSGAPVRGKRPTRLRAQGGRRKRVASSPLITQTERKGNSFLS